MRERSACAGSDGVGDDAALSAAQTRPARTAARRAVRGEHIVFPTPMGAGRPVWMARDHARLIAWPRTAGRADLRHCLVLRAPGAVKANPCRVPAMHRLRGAGPQRTEESGG